MAGRCRLCGSILSSAPDPAAWIEVYEKFGFNIAMKWGSLFGHSREVYLRALLDMELEKDTFVTPQPEGTEG